MFLPIDNYLTSVFFTLVCKRMLLFKRNKYTHLDISDLQLDVFPYLILNEFYILSK
ncbi:hypothetical protein Palpr_2783 [Paludibacter propionicigenes WB4]|uniref:Uncharacterized protein n=1 Tax=Paludibacter propionicigenes (strain DSM 17365 / JCM 13257 / WB4) TaxID=694427 RepID=E4T868_PALPW|nr:hypothetical protein Palpr_2783 [Paludibacter propionicigenes WB4]